VGLRFGVGVTDKHSFDYSLVSQPDEADFWQPSFLPCVASLKPAATFLFKLHAPHHFTVGGASLMRFSAPYLVVQLTDVIICGDACVNASG
jgi:putative restriction endonuclease